MPWAPQRGVQIPSGYDFFSTTRTHSHCIGMLTVGKQDVDSVETGAADSLIRARQGQPKARSARCARDVEPPGGGAWAARSFLPAANAATHQWTSASSTGKYS